MTLAELRRLYSLYKRRYYAGSGLPPVSRISFQWGGPCVNLRADLAGVRWESESHCLMGFHPMLKNQWVTRLAKLVLLHEMAHLKNPRADHGPWFEQEATRLGAEGALREFWI